MSFTCIIEKPFKSEAEFTAFRAPGLGGSDIGTMAAATAGDDSWSCKRAILLSKHIKKKDDGSTHIARGKFLEAPVAALYASINNFKVETVGGAYIKEYPFIRANTDRLVTAPDGSRHLLEIKCPSYFTFKKYKKEGLPYSYIAQMQWQLLCYGFLRGEFFIYCAETHEYESFMIERDIGIIKNLITEATALWREITVIKNGIDTDIFTATQDLCRGGALGCEECAKYGMRLLRDDAADALPMPSEVNLAAAAYVKINEELKALESAKELERNKIAHALGEAQTKSLSDDSYRVAYSSYEKDSFDTKAFKAQYPDIYKQFEKKITVEQLRVTKL